LNTARATHAVFDDHARTETSSESAFSCTATEPEPALQTKVRPADVRREILEKKRALIRGAAPKLSRLQRAVRNPAEMRVTRISERTRASRANHSEFERAPETQKSEGRWGRDDRKSVLNQ
jgi:hypothetical protein